HQEIGCRSPLKNEMPILRFALRQTQDFAQDDPTKEGPEQQKTKFQRAPLCLGGTSRIAAIGSAVDETPHALSQSYGQAEPAISTAQLTVSPRLHLPPIKRVIFPCPSYS